MTREEIAALYVQKGKVASMDEALRLADAYIEKKNPPARVKEEAPAPPRPVEAAKPPPARASSPTARASTAATGKPQAAPVVKKEVRPVEGPVHGPEAPPVAAPVEERESIVRFTVPAAGGTHVADPYPSPAPAPRRQSELEHAREMVARSKDANREVLERYVRGPARGAAEWLRAAPGRARALAEEQVASGVAAGLDAGRAEQRRDVVVRAAPAPSGPGATAPTELAAATAKLRAIGVPEEELAGYSAAEIIELAASE